MIIHPDPKITKSYVSHIRVKLMEKGIKSHIVGVQTTPDDFFAGGFYCNLSDLQSKRK